MAYLARTTIIPAVFCLVAVLAFLIVGFKLGIIQ